MRFWRCLIGKVLATQMWGPEFRMPLQPTYKPGEYEAETVAPRNKPTGPAK